jgi:hypothetical protein
VAGAVPLAALFLHHTGLPHGWIIGELVEETRFLSVRVCRWLLLSTDN